MKRIISLIAFFTAFLTQQAAFAQDAEMADGMRANGKIYVVVAIILIVLVGLIIYLFLTDRKLTRIERQLQDTVKPKRV
ncbi:MAG TPA: CcmD family protein [Chryseosolibacter sp.]